jgi:hypothetical protein
MEADQRAGLLQHGARLHVEIASLDLASGAVHDNDGTRRLGGCDLVCDLPTFADVMQDDREPELFLQAEHRRDVIVSMGVMVHRAPALEGFNNGFQSEVACRQLVRTPRARRILSRYS